MTDTPANGAPTNGAPLPTSSEPSLRILAQFTRDLSFENPHAPDDRRNSTPPQIDLGVEMEGKARQDGLFEVDLKLSVRATRGDQTTFHAELVYGGLFEITNVPEEHLEPVLLIECPRMLFPFARRIIADCTGDGGFPPFLMEPIDFAAVYGARRMQPDEVAGNA